MTLDEAEAAVYAHISGHWTATPIAWHNVDARNFSDASQPLLPQGTVSYLDVRTTIIANVNVSVPVGCVRTHAQLQVSLLVREGTGTRNLRRLQAELIAALENARLLVEPGKGSIRIGTLVGAAGYQQPNGWYVESSAFPFYFERYAAHS